jgi:hypothetical protein
LKLFTTKELCHRKKQILSDGSRSGLKPGCGNSSVPFSSSIFWRVFFAVCGRASSCWSNTRFRFTSAGYFSSKAVYIFSNFLELTVRPSGTSS